MPSIQNKSVHEILQINIGQVTPTTKDNVKCLHRYVILIVTIMIFISPTVFQIFDGLTFQMFDVTYCRDRLHEKSINIRKITNSSDSFT